MLRKNQEEEEQADSDTEEAALNRNSVENYSGIAIMVTFNSKIDEGLRMGQLSGGF